MKRRSQANQKHSGGKRKRSSYAAKQGRGKGKDGKERGRTRYAVTSPFHPDYVTQWGHRHAEVALLALKACHDQALRSAQ